MPTPAFSSNQCQLNTNHRTRKRYFLEITEEDYDAMKALNQEALNEAGGTSYVLPPDVKELLREFFELDMTYQDRSQKCHADVLLEVDKIEVWRRALH